MGIPANLIVGDSAMWKDSPMRDVNGKQYDASAYTLTYELRGPGQPLSLTAAADGQGWKTTLSITDSEKLVPGTWFWAAIATATGERVTLVRGQLDAIATFTGVGAGYDGRSAAEIALADAESALANLTKSGQRVGKYTIGNRSAQYYTPAELIQAISYWKIRVANERRARSVSDGLGDPSNLCVRFNRL